MTRRYLEDKIVALDKVAILAGMIVLETPTRSSNSQQSYVRRALIAQLEAALVKAGYDMAFARKHLEKAEKAQQRLPIVELNEGSKAALARAKAGNP